MISPIVPSSRRIAVEGADRVVSITAAQTRKHSRAAAAAKRIEELDN
jgi:hypothetical protein